jgi:hypothetical protein
MLSVKLTSDGDFDLSDGYLKWTDGLSSVIQHVKSRLNFAQNTFYVFPEAGLPYIGSVVGQKNVEFRRR